MTTEQKQAIMIENIRKKQAVGYDVVQDELYMLPPDAGQDVNNSYFFTATAPDGESLYIRLGLRGDGSKEVWFGYRKGDLFVANEKELYLPGEDCPLSVACAQPGELWDIVYKDTIAKQDGTKCAAHFIGRFTATGRIFDFFYDNDPTTTAKAMAAEEWSEAFFAEVEKNNQRHYEQQGVLNGELTLDRASRSVCIAGARDHSYGKRDWSYMNMHVWLLAVDENGNCLNISMVSYPAVRAIWTGHTSMRTGEPESFVDVRSESNLVQAGHSDGKIHLVCTFADGGTLDVYAERERYKRYYFENKKYVFDEGMGAITINGKRVHGCIEFSFHADESRWNGLGL